MGRWRQPFEPRLTDDDPPEPPHFSPSVLQLDADASQFADPGPGLMGEIASPPSFPSPVCRLHEDLPREAEWAMQPHARQPAN